MIVTKAIKPKKLKVDAMRLELLTGMHEVGRDAVKEYKKTVSTWSNPPDFEALISLQNPGPTMVVGATGNTEAVKHYRFVDEGTSVRHAVMSRDWKSKTVPNVIGSFPGQGKVVFISKKINLPGIKARNFDKMIEKLLKPQFKRRMEEAMRNAAKKSGMQL